MKDWKKNSQKKQAESAVEIDQGLIFPVGKVVGFHGLAGIMKVKPSSNNPSLLLDIKTVQIANATGQVSEFKVREIYLDRRMLFIKLVEFDDRTAVEQFIDCHVSTTRQQLRELDKDEWWISDLKGLEVYKTSGEFIGTVSDILGANSELLEIKLADKDSAEPILVPFVEQLVPVVDIKTGRIEVVDLPGLLEPE